MSVVEVARDRRVALAFGERFLIEAHVLGDLVLPSQQAPLDGALHDAVRLVPTETEDARGTENVGLPEHVDGEAFEQQREPRPWLGPRDADLPHAVLVTPDARNAGVQDGLELATVQVPPRSLLVVVMQPARRLALGARPRLALRVLREHVHAHLLHVQLDSRHSPRRLQAKNPLIQLRVSHRRIVRPAQHARRLAHALLHSSLLRRRLRATAAWAVDGHPKPGRAKMTMARHPRHRHHAANQICRNDADVSQGNFTP